MKSAVTLATAVLCLLTAGAVSAQDLQVLKSGDVVQIQNQNGRYLSWYKGDWVVTIPDNPPGDRGTWTLVNVKVDGSKTKFNLINKHSGTALDGDSDNSVVLDDSDHTSWCVNAKAVYSTSARNSVTRYQIYNVDWSGKYGLQEKVNDVKDVVLRESTKKVPLQSWSFVRISGN